MEIEYYLQQLKSCSADKVLTREDVLAYSCVLAISQHWPSFLNQESKDLLQNANFVFEREPDRVIKQRRIFLAQLSAFFSST